MVIWHMRQQLALQVEPAHLLKDVDGTLFELIMASFIHP